MTNQAVQVIITVVIELKKRELHKDIQKQTMESAIKDLSQEVGQAIFSSVLQILDDQMQKIPKSWKNVGEHIMEGNI